MYSSGAHFQGTESSHTLVVISTQCSRQSIGELFFFIQVSSIISFVDNFMWKYLQSFADSLSQVSISGWPGGVPFAAR